MRLPEQWQKADTLLRLPSAYFDLVCDNRARRAQFLAGPGAVALMPTGQRINRSSNGRAAGILSVSRAVATPLDGK
jgi:hypothetical protein